MEIRAGNRMGRAGLDQANGGLGENQAKILTAQPALKIRLVGPNSLLKAKKIRMGRAIPGLAIFGPAKFGPVFFGPII